MADLYRSDAYQRVVDSLRGKPEDWTACKHTIRHHSGLTVWTANGWSACSFYAPIQDNPPRRWRRRLYAAAKEARAYHVGKLVTLPRKENDEQ